VKPAIEHQHALLVLERGGGETADQALPAGSFFALPPGTAQDVFIEDETVI
jgi:hypothetical protein